MKTPEVLKPALKSSAAWTALLTLLFFLFNRMAISTSELLITIPFNGASFDSVYRISLVLSAVYTFAVINRLDDIGFFPVLNWMNLWTSLWVWFVFYLFVLIVGFNVDFIKYVGHDFISQELLRKIVLTLIVTFLHTAIFEELFFRGILQNMLAKRIAQTNSWKIFMIWGFVCRLPLALLVGYTYIKTRNVFYSALVHTLVNSSELIFGFEYIR